MAKAKSGKRASAEGTLADLVPPGPAPAVEKAKVSGRGLRDQLVKLGIARDQDLVLHLPLRYEDHTRVVPLSALALG